MRSARARRAVLAQEQHRHELALASARQDLANELRAAYLIDTVEPLKLLLNQQDPASAGRLFVYYSYFARAHAREIERVNAELGEIGRLDQSLPSEEARLQELESERHARASRARAGAAATKPGARQSAGRVAQSRGEP